MKSLVDFMQGTFGRLLRAVLGLALIYIGLAVVGGTAGLIVAVIGIVPIAMGVWGPCLLGLVFKPA
jgi:hypothetical protein